MHFNEATNEGDVGLDYNCKERDCSIVRAPVWMVLCGVASLNVKAGQYDDGLESGSISRAISEKYRDIINKKQSQKRLPKCIL